MKKSNFYILAIIILLGSCEKNTFRATERTGIEGKSLLKVGLFTMNTVPVSQLIYLNGARSSSLIASPYPYPGGGFNTGGGSGGDYFSLNPGVNTIELYTTNPGTANTISKIFETSQTLEVNQKYTVYIADTASNMVAISALDNGKTPADSGFTNIRFINLIPNSTAVDFYQNQTLLKSNIKYKEFTEFFDIKSGTTDTFSIRTAGAAPGTPASGLANYRLVLNTNRRIFSIVSRGYLGITSLTDPRRPSVSVVVNQ